MEKDIGKIKKNDVTDVVIRLDDFGGRPGVTIREFITGERYTGFTKSGVKIPAADFSKFKEMINSISESDLKAEPDKEPSPEETKSVKKQKKGQKTLPEKDAEESENSDEMPDY